MNRWWTGGDGARWALGLVNGSDIRMGVGTAVLGYHGLAAGELLSLASTTLVDGDMLVSKLDEVDLMPVAIAVSKSLEPVLGQAADAYGLAFADDLHDRAVATSVELLHSLTSAGMPYPSAVDRVIAVHGIPADRLGPVSKHLREQRLAPRMLDDYADRALMEYALHRGDLEARPEPVAKASAFEENEHPRSKNGRFRRVAEGGADPEAGGRKDRAARQQRGLRRMKSLVEQQKRIEDMHEKARKAKPSAGAQMKRAVGQPEAKKRPGNALGPGTAFGNAMIRQQAGINGARKKEAAEGIVVEETTVDYTPTDEERYENLTTSRTQRPGEHSMLGKRYLVLTNDEWSLLQSMGLDSFSSGGFKQETGHDMQAYTAEDMSSELQRMYEDDGKDASEFVVLRMDGRIPLGNGVSLHEDEGAVSIPDSANLEITDMSLGGDYDDDIHVLSRTLNPAMKDDHGYRYPMVVDIRLSNDKMFPLTQQDKTTPLRRYGSGLPHDMDDDGRGYDVNTGTWTEWDGGKSDAFQERQHPRDGRGRFKDKDVQPTPAKNARQERAARMRRGLRRQVDTRERLAEMQRVRQEQEAAQAARQQQAQPRASLAPMKQRPGNAFVLGARTRAHDGEREVTYENMAALRFGANDWWTFSALTGFGRSKDERVSDEDMYSLADIIQDHTAADLVEGRTTSASKGSLKDILDTAISRDNRVTTVKNQKNGKDALFNDPDAYESAVREAERIESRDAYGNVAYPYIERVGGSDGEVFTAKAIRMPDEPAGYQIAGSDEAIAELMKGNTNLVEFVDQGVRSARDLIVESGLDKDGIDPREYPDLSIRVVHVKLRDNASDEEDS